MSPPLTRAIALARRHADLETLKGSTNEESQDQQMDIEEDQLLDIPLTDTEAKEALIHARKAARKLTTKGTVPPRFP